MNKGKLMVLVVVSLLGVLGLAQTVAASVQLEMGAYFGPGTALSIENDLLYGRVSWSGIVFESGGGRLLKLGTGLKKNFYENEVLLVDGKLGGNCAFSYDGEWSPTFILSVDTRLESFIKLTDQIRVGAWSTAELYWDPFSNDISLLPIVLPLGGLAVRYEF